MIRTILKRAVLLLPIVLPAGPATAGTWDAIEHLEGQPPVTLKVEGKPRLYYRVTPAAPLTVPIDGPARLRLTSRVEYQDRKRSTASYTLRALDGTHELEHQSTETAPSDQVRGPAESGKVGKSRRMTVEVPAGHHEIRIALEGASAVLVRLHQAAPRRGGEPMVTLTPIDAPRSVMVSEGQKSIPYHSAMSGRPVRLRFEGPTTLEVVTRLDFDATMRGTHAYRLAIDEGTRRVREVEYRTTKSTTASYTNLKDRIPSKFDRLQLPFGAGMHEITVDLQAPAGGVAEIHARIPQPIAGNEE